VCQKKSNVYDPTDIQSLNDITLEDTVTFIPPITEGKVLKVYDGDTITIGTRFPNSNVVYRFSVRLSGIDAPEMKGKTDAEKQSALRSRDRLSDLILFKMVRLENVKYEKYGRILADVYLGNVNVCSWMVAEKLAKPYNGGKKEEFLEDCVCDTNGFTEISLGEKTTVVTKPVAKKTKKQLK